MNTYQKTAAVGLFVMVGLVLFVGGALWLRGKSLGSADLNIIYADIGNLKEGAPVRISGAPVGRVTDILFEREGRVIVGLKFAKPLTVTDSATAPITSVGMLGDEVIMLNPGKGRSLAHGDTITGSIAPGVFDKAAIIADQAAQTLTKVNAMLDPKLVADLRNTLASSQRFMAFLADQQNGPTSQVKPTLLALQRTTATLDSTLGAFDVNRLQSRVDTTMQAATLATNRLAAMTAHADSLMTRIERGPGTIHMLMTDTTLYTDLRKTMQGMTALLNELAKNPGKISITVHVP